jgi:hypothetical protein
MARAPSIKLPAEGFVVRRRLLLGLLPALLAGMATLASAAPTVAAGGVIENGTTTYVVNPAKLEIDVTVQLSIQNNTPPVTRSVVCGGSPCVEMTNYEINTAYLWVPTQAGAIKAGASPGKVKQAVYKTTATAREIKFTYETLGYGGTMALTATYAIPAAPRAPGGYRAGKAYASFCASGSGIDSGALKLVMPDGFDVVFTGGTELSQTSDTAGVQTFGSGTISAPDEFWTCVEATDQDNLTATELTTGGQTFDIEVWPEDTTWAATVGLDVQSDVQKLEDLTGLKMPGGTIDITEAGGSQLGDYAGSYSASTKTATVTEDTDNATVSHELSHIWFNADLFTDTWMDEGFAGYSEKVAGSGNYKPCQVPGTYPGTGSPDLTTWKYLDVNSSTKDQSITDWQYAASCYLVTAIADAIGPANFKAVLDAASAGEIAYVGASPAEPSPVGGPPISPKALLDLIDERGMVPAGIADLDQAQNLFAEYGIFSSTDLAERSTARSNYHQLLGAAGTWKMPLAVRSPMASWDFAAAQTAMDTVNQILTLRDRIQGSVSILSLDGTAIQTQFEAAKTQADLDALLALTKRESDAAARVAQAQQLNDGGYSIFQTIGLLGTDPGASIGEAAAAIKNVKPDDASAAAQKAIDAINGASTQGLIRLGILLGLLLALFAAGVSAWRRRRRATVSPVTAAGAAAWPYGPPGGYDPAAWAPAPPAPPQGWAPAPPAMVPPPAIVPPDILPPINPVPPAVVPPDEGADSAS